MVNDRYSEVVLCAAVLADPKQYPQVRHVHRDWFNSADYRALWVAICWLLDADPDLSGEELVKQARLLLLKHNRDTAAQNLAMLTTAFPDTGPQAKFAAYSIVLTVNEEEFMAAVQRTEAIALMPSSLHERATLMREHWGATLDRIEGAVQNDLDPTVQDLNTAMNLVTRSEYDWVIPGLLERQERFMLIAPEKAGKSVLSRQVALMLAVGQHPFHAREQVPVMRTLVVDLENPEAVLWRDFRRQVDSLDMWTNENQHVWVMHRPAGLHLGDPRDEQALVQAVAMTRPDLVVISPIYKTYDGLDQSWEEQAYGVQKPLDRLRERFRCALWMEHHSPWGERGKQREIRPIGSSRWARWLDYQAMLVPEDPDPPFMRLRWRSIQRDERKLAPSMLLRGERGGPSWVPEWGEGGFALAMDVAQQT